MAPGELEALTRLIKEKEMLINLMSIELGKLPKEERAGFENCIQRIANLEQANLEELSEHKKSLGRTIQTMNLRKKVLDRYKNCL
jgi:hypothetical protein